MVRRVWGDGHDEDETKRTMPSGSSSLPSHSLTTCRHRQMMMVNQMTRTRMQHRCDLNDSNSIQAWLRCQRDANNSDAMPTQCHVTSDLDTNTRSPLLSLILITLQNAAVMMM